MPRVSFPSSDEQSADYRRAVANRPPLNLYRMLPRAGAVAVRFLEMGETIRKGLALPPQLREIAIVRVGVRTGAKYEVHHHSALARRAGVTDDVIAAIKDVGPGGLAALDSGTSLVVRYVDALIDEVRADDDLFAAMETSIGTDQVAELTMVIGFYLLVSRFLTNFDIEIEDGLRHDAYG